MHPWLTGGAILMALGLALNSLLGPFAFDTIDYDLSETIGNQAIGLDAVSLLFVAPLTLIAAGLTYRGFALGPIALVAISAYSAYMMVQYLVGPNYTVAPRVFPFQLGLFIVSVLVGIAAWAALPLLGTRGAGRSLTWAMFAVAAFVILRYLEPLLGSATEETLPNEYAENPAFFWTIALMDLGLFVPAAIAAGAGLLRGAAWAPHAAYAIVAWFVLVTVAVTGMAIAMYANDDEFASAGSVVMFGGLSVVVLVFAGWVFRGMGRNERL